MEPAVHDPQQTVFIYDGDCAFCTKAAQFLLRRVKTEADVVAWQDVDFEAMDLSFDDVLNAVQWVDPKLTKAGPDAIAVLLRRAQWFWKPIGWVLSLKPVSWLAWPVYRLVARNRHKLPGGTAACAMPATLD